MPLNNATLYSSAVKAQPPNRRERLRAETTAEIKATALELMSSGGPDAISLRAIARSMGMTANAIYGYFATRDELITALINDVYTSLMDTVESSRDALPDNDSAGRILAWAEAFRGWSLSNPEGFRLIYGDAVPGYRRPQAGAAPTAADRACLGLVELAAAADLESTHSYRWSDFDAHLTAMVNETFPDVQPDTVALAVRMWGRMHGLVALEIYGHLAPLVRDPAAVYRDEISDLIRSLRLTPPS